MLFRRQIVRGCLVAALAWTGFYSDVAAWSQETRLGYWHYQGASQIRSLEGGQVFKSIMESEDTGPVRNLIFQKLASAPDKLIFGLQADAPAQRRDLLLPLIGDLLESESYGEVHGISPGVISFNLGIRLSKEQRINWNTKLRQFAGSYGWEINPPLSEGMTSEWEATSSESGFLIRYAQVEDWTLLSVGSDALTQLLDWGKSVEDGKFPPLSTAEDWWTVNLDLQALNKLTGGDPSELALDSLTLGVSGDGDYLRTHGSLQLTGSLDDVADEWSVPVNLILEPIISFSALRNLPPLVSLIPGMKQLFPDGIPSQAVAWSRGARMQGTKPGIEAAPVFLNYVSWPVAEEALPVDGMRSHVARWLQDSLLKSDRATLNDGSEPNSFHMTLVPAFILPFIQGVEYEGKPYHLAGLTHRLVNRTNPPPPSLFAQIENHPRLRYYHWEITGEKVYQYRGFLNMLGFMFDKGQLQQDSPLFGWTKGLESKLGNSVTQILSKSANTLEIQRKSHFGLTGFEIALIAKWIHSNAFPWVDVDELNRWEFPETMVPGQNNRPR
ncbi:MAG: hypothetical protein ACFHW5_08355 [Verrucomicrobiota bacterium]